MIDNEKNPYFKNIAYFIFISFLIHLIVVTYSSCTEHVHRMLCAVIYQTYIYNVHNEYVYKQIHVVNSCLNYFLLMYNLKYLVPIGHPQHLEKRSAFSQAAALPFFQSFLVHCCGSAFKGIAFAFVLFLAFYWSLTYIQ